MKTKYDSNLNIDLGNIFVYDVSREVRELFKIEAHDSEVLSLDFLIVGQIRLLASGSRDRFLHIFDITKVSTNIVYNSLRIF